MTATRAGLLCSVALLLACPRPSVLAILQAGTAIPVLADGSPVKERCPEEARQVMRALNLRPGVAAMVEIDSGQVEVQPLTVYAGPIESITTERMASLDVGTSLYGWLWTTERGVVIRYYRARMPGGEVIPICAVARRGGDELAGKPGEDPHEVELEASTAAAFIVEEFL